MVRVGTKSTAEEATLNLLIMYLPLTWSCSNENKTHCSNYAAYKKPFKKYLTEPCHYNPASYVNEICSNRFFKNTKKPCMGKLETYIVDLHKLVWFIQKTSWANA